MDPSSCLSNSPLASSTTPQQKLKNACDLCSTFKIRCDKGKPSCGRCANLRQPCSYSPARRAGRPHRLRQQHRQQQQQLQRQPQVSEQQHKQQQQLETSVTSSFDDHHVSFATGPIDWGGHDWGMELFEGADPAAAIPASQVSGREHQSDKDFIANRSAMDIPLPIGHIDPQLMEPPPPAANDYFPRRRSEGGVADGDCARTAASIVEQLDPAYRSAAAPPTESISQVTAVCQRLLTILVCPCSEQAAVALLVASACIALMDAVLYQQQQQQHQASDEAAASSSALPPSFAWPPLTQPSPHHRHSRPLPLPASLNGPYSDQGEFEGLSKIAKVVLRFTQRYALDIGGKGTDGARRALVEPIVILLRSKLQVVTEEATGRLVL